MSTPARRSHIVFDHPSAIQIGDWLRKHVLTYSDEKGDCDKLIIRHFTHDGRLQGDVSTIRIDKEIFEQENGIDWIVQQVCEAAQGHADSLASGVQTFGVYAHYRSDSSYSPHRKFRVAAQESVDPANHGLEPSEPATPQGLLSQLMRHNEANTRLSVTQSSNLVQILMEDNRSQRQLIERMLAQSVDLAGMMQEMMDNATHRRIEEKKAETTQQITSTIFEHLKLILPVIFNKLAGEKIAPESDASFTMFAALWETMPEAQQQDFVTKFLNPAQATVFANFLELYEKRKRQLTSKENAAPINPTRLFENKITNTEDPHTSSDPQLSKLEKGVRSFKSHLQGLPSLPTSKPET